VGDDAQSVCGDDNAALALWQKVLVGQTTRPPLRAVCDILNRSAGESAGRLASRLSPGVRTGPFMNLTEL
jgi:hypothetical protein